MGQLTMKGAKALLKKGKKGAAKSMKSFQPDGSNLPKGARKDATGHPLGGMKDSKVMLDPTVPNNVGGKTQIRTTANGETANKKGQK